MRLSLSLILLALAAPAQTIPVADLQQDLSILRQAYETLHPGLYRYNTKAEMDAKFEALGKQFQRDLSQREAYLALSVFTAQIKCGHTYANFFNQSKAVKASLFQGQNRVPFYFRWLNRSMVVTKDFTLDHQLPRGTEVLSINGITTPQILERLMTIARADGSNDAKRIASLEVFGDSLYETFDVYFPLFFPQKSIRLALRVRLPGENKPQSLTVDALTHEQRIAPIQAREASLKGGSGVQFQWKTLADGSAVLTMPTWALYDSKWDWKTWLNARLDEAADSKAPALIVDLRGNEGGNDIGNEILKRIVREDVKLTQDRRLVRYRETPASLNPYLDTWDPSFKKWGAAAVDLEQPWPTAPSSVPYFLLKRYDDAPGGDVIRAEGKPFRGKMFVLIDANNSSATFQFARIVQRSKLGTLVGQPTGGNQRGINGGAFFFLRLPKSGLEVDLPLIGSFPTSPQPDAGLTPDVQVMPTLRDITQGNDVEMAKVMSLLRH